MYSIVVTFPPYPVPSAIGTPPLPLTSGLPSGAAMTPFTLAARSATPSTAVSATAEAGADAPGGISHSLVVRSLSQEGYEEEEGVGEEAGVGEEGRGEDGVGNPHANALQTAINSRCQQF